MPPNVITRKKAMIYAKIRENPLYKTQKICYTD